MSSSIWTHGELLSSARPASGYCWRLVEAQHHVSTTKITDTRAEQARLEALLELHKPAIPEECQKLHFLLFTPFRYGAPYPRGSRFRRAGMTPGVYYASDLARTAATEIAFSRLLFFADSPDTPWPSNPGEFTAFRARYATGWGVDLMASALDRYSHHWTEIVSYEACQQLADACREHDIDVIRYRSVRDPTPAANIAILRCRAFASSEVSERQTWRIHLGASGVRMICEFPEAAFDFDRATFAADPRIAAIVWNRPARA